MRNFPCLFPVEPKGPQIIAFSVYHVFIHIRIDFMKSLSLVTRSLEDAQEIRTASFSWLIIFFVFRTMFVNCMSIWNVVIVTQPIFYTLLMHIEFLSYDTYSLAIDIFHNKRVLFLHCHRLVSRHETAFTNSFPLSLEPFLQTDMCKSEYLSRWKLALNCNRDQL